MKKNRMMRTAALLLIAVLLTTSVISGTFAKYTTSADSFDNARVATWGFDDAATINLENLFKTAYEDNDNVVGTADVIAPGTTNSASFQFTYNGQEAAPEVAYKFTVDTEGSEIDNDIENNPNIKWALYKAGTAADAIVWGDWQTMLDGIEALSGDDSGTCDYIPSKLPEAFTAEDDTWVVAWKWMFDVNTDGAVDNDVDDTAMGNKGTLDSVKVVISISAEQID